MTRKWTRKGEWALHAGPWRIAKAIVEGEPRYTLTHDARVQKWCGVTTARILGVFKSANEAMGAAK